MSARRPSDFYAAPRSPCRWVKVAWLGSLLALRGQPEVRAAAGLALMAIDDDDAAALVICLRRIARAIEGRDGTRLANDAADTVERAIAEGAR